MEKRAFRGKSVKIVPELAKRICSNGGVVRVFHGHDKRVPIYVHEYRKGASTLPLTPSDARLVHITLPRPVLPVFCGTYFWLVTVADMVYEATYDFVQHLRKIGYCVLAYLDYLLIAPSGFGTPSTMVHCEEARYNISKVMKGLGRSRNPKKGEWVG